MRSTNRYNRVIFAKKFLEHQGFKTDQQKRISSFKNPNTFKFNWNCAISSAGMMIVMKIIRAVIFRLITFRLLACLKYEFSSFLYNQV